MVGYQVRPAHLYYPRQQQKVRLGDDKLGEAAEPKRSANFVLEASITKSRSHSSYPVDERIVEHLDCHERSRCACAYVVVCAVELVISERAGWILKPYMLSYHSSILKVFTHFEFFREIYVQEAIQSKRNVEPNKLA